MKPKYGNVPVSDLEIIVDPYDFSEIIYLDEGRLNFLEDLLKTKIPNLGEAMIIENILNKKTATRLQMDMLRKLRMRLKYTKHFKNKS